MIGKWLVVIAVLGASTPAFAYSTYEECLLERMEGQSANMVNVVIPLCYEEFPLPKPGPTATHDEIFQWALEKASRDIEAKQLRGQPID